MKTRGKNTRVCKIPGCEGGFYSLGYCRMHYDRARIGSEKLSLPGPLIRKFNQKNWAPEEKFFARITKEEGGCWLWAGPFYETGKIKKFVYGRLPVGGGRSIMAHIFAYTHFVGPVPDGHEIHHKCDNQVCVNPKHLESVTKVEHMMESNWPSTVNVFKTQCPNGHDPSEYVRLSTTGNRYCRQCARDRKDYHRERYLNIVRPKVLSDPSYKPRDKIKKTDIPYIFRAYERGESTQSQLSKMFGVTPSAISYVISTERRRQNAPTAHIG